MTRREVVRTDGGRRRWHLSVVVALMLAVLAVMGRGAGDGWFYWPDARVHATPETLGLTAEPVSFAAADGTRLDGWWAPAPGRSLGTVVYCHGNHANLSHHARFVAWLPKRGYNLLLFDYRGYGRSAGAPTRAGTIADALAAIDFALARDPEHTVLFGHSLGGAAGLVAAVQRPQVRAVVVESTFASYRGAARRTAPMLGLLADWLVSAGHDPIDCVAALAPRPLLVVHGIADRIAPVELARELFAAAREPKELHVVDGAGHESPWVTLGSRFEDELCTFFARALH